MLNAQKTENWKSQAWCGPSALSILTGMDLGVAHSRAAFINDKMIKDVEGVYTEDLLILLGEQGKKTIRVDLKSRFPDLMCGPTISRFMASRKPDEYMQPMLLVLPDHFVTAHMNWMCDNWTKKPVPVKDFPKLGRIVVDAYIVY